MGRWRSSPSSTGLFDERFVIDTILGNAPDDRKDSVFAVGLEHGNSTIGSTILNTLFLREHNRIAGVLASEYPDWDDDRLFETTRMIMIVLELKLVVEEYIRHIGPFDFAIEAVPFIADEERWNRPNWIAIEFNLLYRWHSLVPDDDRGRRRGADLAGVHEQQPAGHLARPRVAGRAVLTGARRQDRVARTPRGSWSTGPTPDRPSLEERTIALMRQARLRSFNDYRESYGLSRMKSFAELTSDTSSCANGSRPCTTTTSSSLEWYVGIFAEEYPDYLMMGELLTTMVANDAFTQALTNPLLARNVFNEATFSAAGMEIINADQLAAADPRQELDVAGVGRRQLRLLSQVLTRGLRAGRRRDRVSG